LSCAMRYHTLGRKRATSAHRLLFGATIKLYKWYKFSQNKSELELWLRMNTTMFETVVSWKHESYEISDSSLNIIIQQYIYIVSIGPEVSWPTVQIINCMQGFTVHDHLECPHKPHVQMQSHCNLQHKYTMDSCHQLRLDTRNEE
ncbi:hypothetical protein L9F63_001801, partial [Diploptera punctata]